MSSHELAQLNIALMREPLESPMMADFVANLDRINALAEASPGFIWRLQTEAGNATALRPMGENTLVNISVWKDVPSLQHYVYQSAHVEIMHRRSEWFERMSEVYTVLWWVREGYRPSVTEAAVKLALLRRSSLMYSRHGGSMLDSSKLGYAVALCWRLKRRQIRLAT